MVRFDPVLKVQENGRVVASGPVDESKEEIIDLCAWVYQRGDTDAAVTEMTHDHNGTLMGLLGQGELEVKNNHWSIELAKIGNEAMAPGEDAFAVAVALIKHKQSGKQEVIWWGHPVELAAATA